MKWARDFHVIIATLKEREFSQSYLKQSNYFSLYLLMNEIQRGLIKKAKRKHTYHKQQQQIKTIELMFTVISIWLAIH